MTTAEDILVADECWVALANLQREHPERAGFTAREILERIERNATGRLRAGIQPHIQLHNVANLPPNSARYRLFYRLPGNTYRLFRSGDDYHPARTGKTKPNASELPSEYHDLLAWYDQVYSKPNRKDDMENDPVLQMLGVGRELWQNESGDEFVERERRSWEEDPTPARGPRRSGKGHRA